MNKKVIDAIRKNPNRILISLIGNKYFKWIPDELFLKTVYFLRTKSKLNLKNPQTYNEKLQLLKIIQKDPKMTDLVDKFKVRDYVEGSIGKQYLVPLINSYNSVEEINFKDLPHKFVLKSNHDSGGVVICPDKNKLNVKKTKKILNKSLKRNFYYLGREYPYKNVTPKIICEEFIEDKNQKELIDYRFFCFDGKVEMIALDFSITDKSNTRRNIYDKEWNLLEEEITYKREVKTPPKRPDKLEEMIELSEKLSKEFAHVRVDFYYINNEILFGELTFYHQSGFAKFKNEEFNHKLGSLIQIKSRFEKL
ncbi:hypothetical protein RSA42_15660 [Exiguobacterium indicum]|uniref:ATP-grasp fold amidoligase family protein n=1 Tax=Exiguobacterium indicum TaxID=296995 RepID=UPI000736F3FE|nr:ATP-grasp fold amidoligase family protein [Exiguobacterium indicum]KTR57815.1 hypothetical protein RSA42_15660 [Exiguobacterium indicum]